MPAHACVVLVGDVDQLPSVGPGLVLADLIASRYGAGGAADRDFSPGRAELDRPRGPRHQAGRDAGIGAGRARAISTSSRPTTPEAIIERIVDDGARPHPGAFGLDPLRDVQVLTPMNRSELGSQALNLRLQEVLNPAGGGAASRSASAGRSASATR